MLAYLLIPHAQMVEHIAQMMIERLQLYMKKNGNKLPERIIIYRDGVSEVRSRSRPQKLYLIVGLLSVSGRV